MSIAFIGLGIMGSRMAANLLKNKVDLTVFNRSPEAVKELGSKGAKTANSAIEAAKEADIVFSMLSAPDVVSEVFFGGNKVLASMKSGAIWVDCTTVNPSFSQQAYREAKKYNVQFIDAPVAGTKPVAENAELVFITGGEKSLVDQVEPYLLYMGNKVLHVGETGKGSSFKMLVNLLLAQSMVAFSETVLLGEKMGLDKEFLLDTIPNLPVIAPFVKAKAEMIRNNDYDTQFPLELMYKDLHLAAVTAYENNQSLFQGNIAKELFGFASQNGYERMDFAAIYQFLEGKKS